MEGINITINPEDILTGRTSIIIDDIVTAGSTIPIFYTCSAQKANSSSNYYISLYQSNAATIASTQILDVAYGCYTQSYTSSYCSSSQAIYNQYALQCLNYGMDKFTLDGTNYINQIIAINYNQTLLKDRIHTTGYNLLLSHSTYSASLSQVSSSYNVLGINPQCGRVRYLGTGSTNCG